MNIDYKKLREEAIEEAANIAALGIEAMKHDPRNQHPNGWILPNHVATMAAQIYAAKIYAHANVALAESIDATLYNTAATIIQGGK